ncbi:28783_t:CDS:2, partial [Dentiscutata erythropus]
MRLYFLLLSYCGALNKLQLDTGRLYNVLQAFGGILRMWEEYSDYDLAQLWFGRRPTRILLELEEYRKRRYPFDFATYEQFEDNALQFWEFASPSTKELSPLANDYGVQWDFFILTVVAVS